MQAGAEVWLCTELAAAQQTSTGLQLTLSDTTNDEQQRQSAPPVTLDARWLVNSAGIFAHELAQRIDGLPAKHVPRVRFAKGNYVLAPGEHVFTGLVYPVPEDGGLGAHLTVNIAGDIKFGPDVEWLPEGVATSDLDYEVDPARKERFLQSVREFWPEIEQRKVVLGYSGMRPKLSGPGEPAGDFEIHGPEAHGIQGYVGLYGIESPGLTSCLALAEAVRAVVD
jgi:L-2-hydroxyglutarate oxidase LhgO